MIGIAGAVAPMTMRTEPLALLAVTGTVNVPAVVGVPLMIPVEEFTESPAGRLDAEKKVGERVAVIA